LDSIFSESIKGATEEEETPQFVSEFNNYCANSGKLTRTEFKVSVNSYETPNENYYRILSESGGALIDRLIADSGIEEFRQAITHYLTEEKRPQLFATLADDLQPLCIELKKFYLQIKKQEYYRKLYRLLGNDGNIEKELIELQKLLNHALKSEATSECDKYVRESPRFYDEGTFSIYQFRQTLQQTSQGFDAQSIIEAEPAIRQLLKLDFEPKVSTTIRRNFRQTINQTLKTHLLHLADKQADFIPQHYGRARAYLERGLQQEAETKIALDLRLQAETEEKIKVYNEAVSGVNSCLEAMQLFDRLLPKITDEELHYSTHSIEDEFKSISENGNKD
jgi:hypothetical protein